MRGKTAMACVRDPSPQPWSASRPKPARGGGALSAAAIRPGRDADADGLIALISACWNEYPGIVLDVDGEMPELRALASYYAGKGGALWTAEADGRVVGMIGVASHSDGAWEIVRLYMLRHYRGTDLAPRLLAMA